MMTMIKNNNKKTTNDNSNNNNNNNDDDDGVRVDRELFRLLVNRWTVVATGSHFFRFYYYYCCSSVFTISARRFFTSFVYVFLSRVRRPCKRIHVLFVYLSRCACARAHALIRKPPTPVVDRLACVTVNRVTGPKHVLPVVWALASAVDFGPVLKGLY